MKLYYMPGACSLASHIALIWAGADYRLGRLTHAEAGGEAFRRINPKGAVPVLVLDDGTAITESLAILNYIAGAFPSAELGASAGDGVQRAALDERLAELVSGVHGAWAPVFAPGRFVVEPRNEDEAKQAAFMQLDAQYTRLDGLMAGREWSLFGHRTVADAYLFVMCAWMDKTPTRLAAFPALTAFKQRLDGDAGVERALREEASA